MSKELLKYELPDGWITLTLNEVSLKITDGSHNPPRKQEKGVPMLSAQNIENGKISFDKARLISKEDFISKNEGTEIQHNSSLG